MEWMHILFVYVLCIDNSTNLVFELLVSISTKQINNNKKIKKQILSGIEF